MSLSQLKARALRAALSRGPQSAVHLGFRRALFAALFAGFALTTAAPSYAADHNYRTAADFGVYLGVVPAQIVRGHPASHPEQTMHGGTPDGRHQYHILVAIFEQPSGVRVTDAEVTAKVSGEGHVGGRELDLEPMTIADAVTYGNFIALPGSDRYTIEVHVRRPGKGENSVTFSYQHGQE